MLQILRTVFKLIKKDLMIVVPAITLYLIFFMYLQTQELQELQEDKQTWMVLGAISMVFSIYLQLFISRACGQLMNQRKVDFSRASLAAFKDYFKGIAMYLIFITPLDALALILGNNSLLGTILILLRLFLFFVIPPVVVLNQSFKVAVRQVLRLFRLKVFFEISGLISMLIIWFILMVVMIGVLRLEFILPFWVGLFMTYINMAVFYYIFQTRGKVC